MQAKADPNPFAGWQDITDHKRRYESPAGASIAWRHQKKGVPRAEFILNRRLMDQLGWTAEQKIRVLVSGDRKAVAIMPAEVGKKLTIRCKCATVNHLLDWITSDRRSSRPLAHRIENGAVVMSLPEWAWPTDGPAQQRQAPRAPSKPAAAPRQASAQPAPAAPPEPPPAPPPAPEPPLAPPAKPAIPAWPLGDRPVVSATDTENPPPEDLAEAKERVANGSGARDLHEYFGWPLSLAQQFVKDLREQQAA